MHIFKVFKKLPVSQSDEGNVENLENSSEIYFILNCLRALMIICLSHKGQNYRGNPIHMRCFPFRKPVFKIQ